MLLLVAEKLKLNKRKPQTVNHLKVMRARKVRISLDSNGRKLSGSCNEAGNLPWKEDLEL